MAKREVVLPLKRQALARDDQGRSTWVEHTQCKTVDGAKMALILCDVWDRHWCEGANIRLKAMLPRMNQVVNKARDGGVLIIHAPSDTMDFYRDTPARRRVTETPNAVLPTERELPDPPLPIDASDDGSDTDDEFYPAWTRQHPAIDVDQSKDAVSDSGEEIYSVLKDRGIEQLLIMGVHTNMCILHRSFGIKQMVKWGVSIALVEDLTDTMYNPAKAPYVSHEEGTKLVVGYIEKFWCPTIHSSAILGRSSSS